MSALTKFDISAPVQNGLLAPVNEEAARELAASIDVSSPMTIAGFGQDIGASARDYADSLLTQARSGDIDDMGAKLNEVVLAARKFDIDAFENKWARIPILGGLIAGLSRTKARALAQFNSLEGQVETLIRDVESAEQRLSARAQTMDAIYLGVEEEQARLALHEAAALLRLKDLEAELATLPASHDPAQSARRSALEGSRAALQKRAADLGVLRHSALQTLPMIRMIQANNLVLIEKFQTIRNLTVPAWKRAFMMALALYEQKDAAALANNIDDATNFFMVRNSEILRENAVATARANQRLVIDVATLRKVHENIVNTLIEVRDVNQSGTVSREKAMLEIAQLRDEMAQGMPRAKAAPQCKART